MKNKTPRLFLMLLLFLGLSSHDMFLKLDSYFLEPNSDQIIKLYNGTFDKSENSITRDRMLDVSIIDGNGSVSHPDNSHWSDVDDQTLLKFKTSGEGTYIGGLSTAVRTFDLSAEDFNGYLKHDGILDVYEQRQKEGTLDQDATEMYSKHVKILFQVGDKRTIGFDRVLGYPIEFIALKNPYEMKVGEELEFQLLKKGKPLAGQLVYASYGGYHEHDDSGGHVEAVKDETDSQGKFKVKLTSKGHWYVRAINMVKPPAEDVDYESNWATLTFEIK